MLSAPRVGSPPGPGGVPPFPVPVVAALADGWEAGSAAGFDNPPAVGALPVEARFPSWARPGWRADVLALSCGAAVGVGVGQLFPGVFAPEAFEVGSGAPWGEAARPVDP